MMASKNPTIKVENLHKSFGPLEVLKGVSMAAYDGDVVSIIGASGSGKSTLLRCINLLETYEQGQVWVDGECIELNRDQPKKIRPLDLKQLYRLRANLGFVFQGFNLWSHRTILQNLIEGPIYVLKQSRAEAIEKAEALLHKVGIFDKRHRYPAELSGGQQQRAAIARALAMEPKALLFDEPTSALDPELVSEVLGVIQKLADEGRTMLIVTHEMRFARDVSTEIIFLHQGKIEEQGPPSKVFDQPNSVRCRQFLSAFLQEVKFE